MAQFAVFAVGTPVRIRDTEYQGVVIGYPNTIDDAGHLRMKIPVRLSKFQYLTESEDGSGVDTSFSLTDILVEPADLVEIVNAESEIDLEELLRPERCKDCHAFGKHDCPYEYKENSEAADIPW